MRGALLVFLLVSSTSLTSIAYSQDIPEYEGVYALNPAGEYVPLLKVQAIAVRVKDTSHGYMYDLALRQPFHDRAAMTHWFNMATVAIPEMQNAPVVGSEDGLHILVKGTKAKDLFLDSAVEFQKFVLDDVDDGENGQRVIDRSVMPGNFVYAEAGVLQANMLAKPIDQFTTEYFIPTQQVPKGSAAIPGMAEAHCSICNHEPLGFVLRMTDGPTGMGEFLLRTTDQTDILNKKWPVFFK